MFLNEPDLNEESSALWCFSREIMLLSATLKRR